MAEIDTMDVLKHLLDHEKENFLALEDLFGHPGWKIITKMAEQNCVDAMTRAAFAATWEANRVANGERSAWSQIVRLPESVFAEFAVKALERAGESEDDDEAGMP